MTLQESFIWTLLTLLTLLSSLAARQLGEIRIPEIELPSVEPFRMDELSLSLTTGPNGYKITLRDIDIYNLSNFTVSKLKIGGGGQPFETRILMPELKINARYTSSGVLIIIPASGNGTFHATLGGVAAILRGTVSSKRKDDLDYLSVESLNLDLNIKTVRMTVKKVFNNNRILTEATNLFLRENGHEVLKVMMPQLRTKLETIFVQVCNSLLKHVPIQMFLGELVSIAALPVRKGRPLSGTFTVMRHGVGLMSEGKTKMSAVSSGVRVSYPRFAGRPVVLLALASCDVMSNTHSPVTHLCGDLSNNAVYVAGAAHYRQYINNYLKPCVASAGRRDGHLRDLRHEL
uniref:Uncharacterized protein n=1 Tax=Timema cristinae TaxID=61476 RepID=A0A7R9DA62_TIMCR|nr:unnamed protein product [Timema cristinae]